MWLRMVGTLMAVSFAAACGGGSSGGAVTRPDAASETSAPAPTVSMTIADGSTLRRAVPWQVTAKTARDDAVAEVDFLVDGKQLWVEHNTPYFFNDDHQVLAPWLLGAGSHTLVARVQTVTGATAEASAHVTVPAVSKTDKSLAGTYSRVVTRADQRRVGPYRVPSKGAFGDVSPTGRWTLHVKANGEIVGVDPSGDTANPFVEPFTVSNSTMTLYGPAIWRQPNPEEQNRFCEPESPSDYTWSLAGSSLTITNKQKACADRDIVFVGTWTRTRGGRG